MRKTILVLTLGIAWAGCDDFFITPPPQVPEQPQDRTPAWSPDGQWIAYFHFAPEFDTTKYSTGLYLTDVSGQQRKRILNGPAYNPDWSPDGGKIVFARGDIFVVGKDGGGLRSVTQGGNRHFPQWSPSGDSIAFDRTGTQDTVGIWILNFNSLQESRIGFGSDPDWSPDGRQLVFSGPSGTRESQSQIWLVEIASLNRKQLTFNNHLQNNFPAWSPDGKMIAWTTGQQGEIWLMEADGSNQRKLVDGVEPFWSPDSRKLVFSRTVSLGKMVLWMIDLDGTNLRQLTN